MRGVDEWYLSFYSFKCNEREEDNCSLWGMQWYYPEENKFWEEIPDQ